MKPPFLHKELRTESKPIEVELAETNTVLAKAKNQIKDFEDKFKSSYLNPEHPYFARELTIAMECWKALFASGTYVKKRIATKAVIIKWLEKKGENLPKSQKLSGNAKERIATLINPVENKTGGLPKIEDLS